MKKSIVLIITLLFVAAVSALIYQNIDDTDSYMKQQNYKFNKTQLLVSVKNVQEEVSRIFLQKQDAVDKIVDSASEFVPLKIKDVNVLFRLDEYEKVNVNLLSKSEEKDYAEIKNIFNNNDINDFDIFRFIFKENKQTITNEKQKEVLIEQFINESLNTKINKIKNKLGFLSKPDKDKFYELFINVNYLEEIAKAYYILNKKGEVKYFELSFK